MQPRRGSALAHFAVRNCRIELLEDLTSEKTSIAEGSIAMPVVEKPLYYLTIHEAQKLIQSRALSPVELTREVLDRIKAVDEKLHAYIDLMSDSALKEAQAAETEIQRGNWRGP